MNKQKLILLHGALGSAEQFSELKEILSQRFDIIAFSFAGHGGNDFPENGFSIPLFAEQLRCVIEKNNLSPAKIFGYSMGGYVALYLARHSPASVNRVLTLATKFNWNPESAAREAALLDPEKILDKIPAFANQLEERHRPQDWKKVLKNTADMMNEMGSDPPLKEIDFLEIRQYVLVTVGDRDKMVSIEETASAAGKMKKASLHVFPDTPHPFEQVDMEMLKEKMESFFQE